jgi:hypothetical protein
VERNPFHPNLNLQFWKKLSRNTSKRLKPQLLKSNNQKKPKLKSLSHLPQRKSELRSGLNTTRTAAVLSARLNVASSYLTWLRDSVRNQKSTRRSSMSSLETSMKTATALFLRMKWSYLLSKLEERSLYLQREKSHLQLKTLKLRLPQLKNQHHLPQRKLQLKSGPSMIRMAVEP